MSFQPAQKKKSKLRLAITGPAGGGKTLSALRIAWGIGGKIAVICTEHGSANLYEKRGKYDVDTISPPYTGEKYIEKIKLAERCGYNVLIIDSLSHAWSGEGGILDKVNSITKKSSSGNSYIAWGEATPLHNKLIDTILQSPLHVIVTMRSKTEYAMAINSKGKAVPQKIGMAPIQRDGIDYEFTTVFDLSIDHYASASKDRTEMFTDMEPMLLTEEIGQQIYEWLNDGESAPLSDYEKYLSLPFDVLDLFDKIDPSNNQGRRIATCQEEGYDPIKIKKRLQDRLSEIDNKPAVDESLDESNDGKIPFHDDAFDNINGQK